MKKSHRWAVLATLALFLCCVISLAVAQGPGAAPAAPAAQSSAGPRLALLDVTYIFKKSERFKAKMEDMKRDYQVGQKKLQAERNEIIKQINEELSQYNKGTPEYQAKEEAIANREGKLRLAFARQKEEFTQREAQIFYETFQEIMKATNSFCQQHSIDMVFRFEGEKSDPSRPETVAADLNKTVIWYDARWVITDYILADLNRSPVNAPRGTEAVKPTNPYQTQR